MKKFISASLVFAQLATALPALGNQAPNLPTIGRPQQDRIIVQSEIDKKNPDYIKFAAIAQAVWAAGQTYDRAANGTANEKLWRDFQPLLPLPPRTEEVFPAESRENYIERVAQNEHRRLEGILFQSPVAQLAVESTSALGEVFLGRKFTSWGMEAALALAGPYFRDGAMQLITVDPATPNLNLKLGVEASLWGLDQARQRSTEGGIVDRYATIYGVFNPHRDQSEHEAVRSQATMIQTIRNARDIGELRKMIESNPKIAEAFEKIASALEDQKLNATNQPAASAGGQDDLKYTFNNITGGLNSLSYALQLSGHPREAAMVGNIGKASEAVGIVATAQQMAPLMAASIYLYAAVMVYSAIQASQQPESPYPAIFAMLAQISQQIEELRKTVLIRFSQLDQKLGAFAAESLALSEAQLRNSVTVNEVLKRIQAQLSYLLRVNQEQSAALANILFNQEDRRCFYLGGGGEVLPISRNRFVECRSTYIDRGTSYARSAIAHASAPSAAVQTQFPALPFADRYEILRQVVDPAGTEFPRPLAHPAVWAQSSFLLAELAQQHPKYLGDLDAGPGPSGGIALQVEPLVQAGEDLAQFRSHLLFPKNGTGLHTDRIQAFVDRLSDHQATALEKIRQQLTSPGSNIDPTRGLDQPFNPTYPFHALAQPLPFCEGVRPRFHSLLRAVIDSPGGSSGVKTAVTRHTPNLRRWALEELQRDFRGLKSDELSWNEALYSLLPREAVLMEQARKGRIDLCISILQVSDYRQAPSLNFTADVHLGIKAYISMSTPTGRSNPLLIRDILATIPLEGRAQGAVIRANRMPLIIRSGEPIFINGDARIATHLANNWSRVYRGFLRYARNRNQAEANRNLERVRGQLTDYLAVKRNDLEAPLLNGLQGAQEDYQQTLANLRALIGIGLDENHAPVNHWLSELSARHTNVAPLDLVNAAIHRGENVPNLLQTVSQNHGVLKQQLEELAKDPLLRPAPNHLAPAMHALDRLYEMRSLPQAM